MPFLADAEHFHHPAAVGVARHDADLQAVEVELVEGEPADDGDAFGDVAIAGVALVDPVADDAALERAAHDVVEVDLAGERVVDEQTEAVADAHLSLAVARRATRAERVAMASRDRTWLLARSGSHGVSHCSLRRRTSRPLRRSR